MNTKIIITYLILYILLNSIGVCIAFHFWWTDSLNLSFFKKESLSLLMSVGFCWIGILYLSILIIRKFIVKINNQKFIGPIDLVSNEMYQKEIGVKNASRFKNSLIFIAFPILILTIITFVTSMNSYEGYELSIYGKVEKIKVPENSKIVAKYIVFDENVSAKILKDTSEILQLKSRDKIKDSFRLGKNVYVVEYVFFVSENGKLEKIDEHTYNVDYKKTGIGLKKDIIDFENVGFDFLLKFTGGGSQIVYRKDTLDIHEIYLEQKLFTTQEQEFAHRKVFYQYE